MGRRTSRTIYYVSAGCLPSSPSLISNRPQRKDWEHNKSSHPSLLEAPLYHNTKPQVRICYVIKWTQEVIRHRSRLDSNPFTRPQCRLDYPSSAHWREQRKEMFQCSDDPGCISTKCVWQWLHTSWWNLNTSNGVNLVSRNRTLHSTEAGNKCVHQWCHGRMESGFHHVPRNIMPSEALR